MLADDDDDDDGDDIWLNLKVRLRGLLKKHKKTKEKKDIFY